MTNNEIIAVYNRYFKEDLKALPKKGTSLLAMYEVLSHCSFAPDQQMAIGELYTRIHKLLELSSNCK
jgi:hypothetical protein